MPHKRAGALVRIPRAAILEGASECEDRYCLACASGDGTKPRFDARRRTALRRADALPLKTLLTIYRWARAYRTSDVSGARQREVRFQASARLSSSFIGSAVAGSRGLDPQQLSRTIQRQIARLTQHGELVTLGHPGAASWLIPHRVAESFVVPNGLWSSGWLHALRGSSLAMLLAVLAHVGLPVDGPEHLILKRSELSVANPRADRTAIIELIGRGLLARVRLHREEYLVLTDPDLLTKP